MDQRASGGHHQQLTVEKLLEYCKHKRIELRVESGVLKWRHPPGAMSPAMKKTLSLRQHEVAKALGGKIEPPKKAPGVIDEDWIRKANEWWKTNVRCWVGLWEKPLTQPPYILADSLGLINLKEMKNADSPSA